MKRVIYGVSTALLTIAASSVIAPASARPLNTASTLVATAPLLPEQSNMTFNFSAPFITSSGALGTNHYIRVAVIGMALKDLMISIPPNMERYSSIQVKTQSGQTIPAKVTATKSRVAITFDQAVTPGNYVEVYFTGIQMNSSGGDILLYGVTAQREGVTGEIPVGTARVQVPSRG